MTDSIPMLSIAPNYIAHYNEYVSRRPRTEKQVENQENLKDNNPLGMISQKASKRMRNAIHWLLEFADSKNVFSAKSGRIFNFKVGFVTLTLASDQAHSDQQIKHDLLNHFLLVAKRKWGVNHYIWKAEAQKNGNIHFHILCDKFIPHKELRNTWNVIQNKLGYVDRFAERNGHSDPNSTDIHSIKHVKNIASYMVKYMVKNDDRRAIAGKIWGLSTSLSQAKPFKIVCENWVIDAMNELATKFPKELKVKDFFSVLYVPFSRWRNSIKSQLSGFFLAHISQLKSRFEQSDQQLLFV